MEKIQLIKYIVWFLIAVALALFCLNQMVELSAKQQLLMSPCELCDSLKQTININWSNLTFVEG